MNKEQTTIEVDALEWWGTLPGDKQWKLFTTYFPDPKESTLNKHMKMIIYLAEHPTAPTVENKEDAGLMDIELKHKNILLASCEGALEKANEENTTLKQSMEELELLLETLIHFTPEDDTVRFPLMKGDKIIKDAFEKIGHVSKNKE